MPSYIETLEKIVVGMSKELEHEKSRVAELEELTEIIGSQYNVSRTAFMSQETTLRKRIAELESMLESRTKEVDNWISKYDKSVTKQRAVIAKLDKIVQAQTENLEEEKEIANTRLIDCSVKIAELEKEKKILYIEAQIDGVELVADWIDGYYAPCVVGVVDELAKELKKLREDK
jgi:hypothetical protein